MWKANCSTGLVPPHRRSWLARREGILSILLIAVTLCVYAQVWRFGFVSMDDPLYVSQNSHVRDGLSLEGIHWAFSTCYYSNWIPLTWLSLMVDATLFGDWTGGFHLTNVLLHLANVLLVFAFFARATGNSLRSAFVAALFAVHPLHAESVAWVAERKDVLSMFFGLLALCTYLRYVQRRRTSQLVLANCCFVFSLLSKQTFVTLPCLLLLLDFWPLCRLNPDGRTAREKGQTIFPLVREKLSFMWISGVFCWIAYRAQLGGGSVNLLADTSLSLRLCNAVLSYGLYLKKAVFPYDLAIFYPHPGSAINLFQVALAFSLLAIITWFVFVQRHRRPFLIVGWLWFLGTLIPLIGLVQIGIQQLADRYTYLSMIGVYAAVAWLFPSLLPNSVSSRRYLATAASCVVIVYGGIGYIQTGYWRDGVCVMRRSLAVTEDNAFARRILGDALFSQFEDDEALAQFEHAVQLEPDDPGGPYELGFALELLGRFDESAEQYRASLAMNEKQVAAHYRLGLVLLRRKNYLAARDSFLRTVELDDNHAQAHAHLATLWRAGGDYRRSNFSAKRALQIDGSLVLCHHLMALNLRDLGFWDEAISKLRHVLTLAPDNEDAQQDLDRLLAKSRNRTLAE